jgi:molecular chaperone DnaK
MLLLDVTPHSLGIMVMGGYFHRLIDRNTTIPTAKSHIFTTTRDDQTSVKILVMQGENDRADENELLGEFVLTGLRKAMRGEVEVEVMFEISADGIVSVSARDMETGQQQSITVTATSGLTEAEIVAMATEQSEYMVTVRADEGVEKERQAVEKLVDEAMALMPRVKRALSQSPLGTQGMEAAHSTVEQAKTALAVKDPEELARMKAAMGRTLQMFKSLVKDTEE